MPQQVTIRASITGQWTVGVDLGSLLKDIGSVFSQTMVDGTGIAAASEHWGDSVSVAQSINTDIDLQTLSRPTGSALVLTGAKALIIRAGLANPGNLTVSPGPTNGWTNFMGGTTPTKTIVPGGVLLEAWPSAAGLVVSGTNKVLRIASAATAGTYTFDFLVVGIP